MSVLSLSIVRNEEDSIETFIRYHAQYIDRMIVVDHGSTDATKPILEALIAEGLPVVLRTETDAAYRQKEVLDPCFQEASLEHPDWILPLDADEFLHADDGDIPRALSMLPADRVTLLPWQPYVPLPTDATDDPDILHRITHRTAIRSTFCKILIPRAFQGPAFSLGLGNHSLLHAADRTACPSSVSAHLSLAHFPVRSNAQLLQKVQQGWNSHEANPAKVPGQNFHWKVLFEESRSNSVFSPDRLADIAARYPQCNEKTPLPALIADPLGSSFSLRYTPWSNELSSRSNDVQ